MKIPDLIIFYWLTWICLFIMFIGDVITTYIGRNTAGMVEANQIIVDFNPGNDPFLHLMFIIGVFII
ncbi:hypothetical protein [Methanoplanus limicola]|uniref:Uncharacterized protein n=1 Tax=Methanoplanus limicola DSM 2279 TaxID=937775 RepID=H1YXY0_9EURY|nr:hypothetical protein [Methanoplanus limicola]EHQ35979.1 hypothetical protein Metlim_1878 [Methanoplanus limicola DSM 2279]